MKFYDNYFLPLPNVSEGTRVGQKIEEKSFKNVLSRYSFV